MMTARVHVLGRSLVVAAAVGASVLSGVALSGTAEAATTVGGPVPVAGSGALSPQAGSPEYREGFRNGLRDGFQDGQNDARLDCAMRGGHAHSDRDRALSAFDNGYGDGYAQGYPKGFDQVRCKFHHGRH